MTEWKPLRPALSAGVAERALGHHHRAFAVDRIDERLGHRCAHILVVWREEGQDVDRVERGDQRIHVDDRDAGLDHLVDRRGQRADAESLDRNEVPLLRRHVVDGGALLDGVKLSVEPGHVDVEKLAPIFGGLLALRAPARLQTGVREGCLERLFGSARLFREGHAELRIHSHAGEHHRGPCPGGRATQEITAGGRNLVRAVCHILPPCALSLIASAIGCAAASMPQGSRPVQDYADPEGGQKQTVRR